MALKAPFALNRRFWAFVLLAAVPCFRHAAAADAWVRHTIDASSRGADGVRLADVNSDGLPDIITGWEEGGLIRIYQHPGVAAVRQAWAACTVGRVRSPEDALLADLDGDGRLDAVSCCEGNTRTIHIHWAPPQGVPYLDDEGWKTAAIPATAGQQLWMFAVPLRRNGRQGVDLIVGSKGANAAIGLLESPDNARNVDDWKYHRLRDAGWIMSLELYDMDGDGDGDILASDRKGARRGVFWLENPGPEMAAKSRWKEHAIGGGQHQVMFLARGLIGRRKQPSVACAVSGGGILLFHPQSAETWQSEEIALPDGVGTGKAVAIGDLDLDGDGDLAFTCENAGGALSGVQWAEFTGEAASPWRWHELGGPEGVKFDRIELLDIDRDGDLDLLTCEERDNLGVVWYENPHRASDSASRGSPAR